MTRIMQNNFAKSILAAIAVGAMMIFGFVLAPSASAHESTDLDSTVDDLVALAIVDSVLNNGGFSADKNADGNDTFSTAFDDIVALAIIDDVVGENGTNDMGNTTDDLVALAIIDSVLNNGVGTNGNGDNISSAFDDIVALSIIDQVLGNGVDVSL